jgi:hypothetical protein
MKQLNPLKIYSLAIFHLIMPKWIKHRFHFKVSPVEHIAIGTMMNRIKYWRHFIRKYKRDNRLHFTSSKYPQP